MKIAVVCDSFKGSLTSKDACAAVKDGLLRCNKNFEVLSLPFADGGEGTSRCFYDILGGQLRKAAVHDPLLREIAAEYTVLPDGTAVIDVASASGLTLLKSSERDAVKVSSLGSGELICCGAWGKTYNSRTRRQCYHGCGDGHFVCPRYAVLFGGRRRGFARRSKYDKS